MPSERRKSPFVALLADPVVLGDDRGHVQILYEVGDLVLKRSTSQKGVFRGLHRQIAPALQEKIIRVISGRILDFVTDPDNPNDVIWCREITPETGWLLVSSNLAHGFYALENVEFEYICNGRYDESCEECWYVAGVVRNALSLSEMYLSDKDRSGRPLLRDICLRKDK